MHKLYNFTIELKQKIMQIIISVKQFIVMCLVYAFLFLIIAHLFSALREQRKDNQVLIKTIEVHKKKTERLEFQLDYFTGQYSPKKK